MLRVACAEAIYTYFFAATLRFARSSRVNFPARDISILFLVSFLSALAYIRLVLTLQSTLLLPVIHEWSRGFYVWKCLCFHNNNHTFSRDFLRHQIFHAQYSIPTHTPVIHTVWLRLSLHQCAILNSNVVVFCFHFSRTQRVKNAFGKEGINKKSKAFHTEGIWSSFSQPNSTFIILLIRPFFLDFFFLILMLSALKNSSFSPLFHFVVVPSTQHILPLWAIKPRLSLMFSLSGDCRIVSIFLVSSTAAKPSSHNSKWMLRRIRLLVKASAWDWHRRKIQNPLEHQMAIWEDFPMRRWRFSTHSQWAAQICSKAEWICWHHLSQQSVKESICFRTTASAREVETFFVSYNAENKEEKTKREAKKWKFYDLREWSFSEKRISFHVDIEAIPNCVTSNHIYISLLCVCL